jgi:hypothetical protein
MISTRAHVASEYPSARCSCWHGVKAVASLVSRLSDPPYRSTRRQPGLGKKEAMRKLVISVLTMLGVAALGSPAQAVVPGANGRIVFTPGRCFRVRS